MKHFAFCFLLFLCLALTTAASLADYGTEICMEEFMRSADASGKPKILYQGVTKSSLTMRSEPSKESTGKGQLGQKAQVDIFGYDQTWLFCWRDDVGIYYLGRHNVDYIEPVDDTVGPYGVLPHHYVAVTARDTCLHETADQNAASLFDLAADTRLSFWMIRDGWAVVPYRRLVGYLWVGDLKELEPVSPTVDYAQEGDSISAFTTFYSLKQTELNIGRMENIRVGCNYIGHTYQPQEEFDFNKIAGPYREARGYCPSPVLIDGSTVAGYGGGTCQVSTTLYNALLQIPDGIEILWRRPHGPGGASYAPHGVDAAVGATNLNLRFMNIFDFPITLDFTVQNGSLCVCIRKGEVPTKENPPTVQKTEAEN